jgi:Tetratricopeptide repeat
MNIEELDRQFHELARQMKEGEECFSRGEFVQAANCFQAALPLLLSAYGESHEDTLLCMDRLANSFFALREYAEALPLLRRLLAIKLRSDDRDVSEMAQLYFVLARTSSRLGRVEDAAEAYRTALVLAEQQHGRYSGFVAAILEGYAGLLRLDNPESEEARQLQEQSREVRARLVDQGMSSRMNKLSILARYAEGVDLGQPPVIQNEAAEFEKVNEIAHDITLNLPSKTTSSYSNLSALRNTTEEPKKNRTMLYVFVPFVVLLCGFLCVLLIGKSETATNMLVGSTSKVTSFFRAAAPTADEKSTEGVNQSARVFESVDGQKRVTLSSEKDLSMQIRGVDLSGHYKISDERYVFKPENQPTTYEFQKSPAGMIDSEGTVLYSADAPERLVAEKMRLLAKAVQSFYMHYRHYPSTLERVLAVVPELSYKNPFTGAISVPTLGANLGNLSQSIDDLGLDDYSRYESGVSRLRLANDPVQIGPGSVEYYHVKYLQQGESFYIRGTDRNGHLLSGSDPSRAYVIILIQGRQVE